MPQIVEKVLADPPGADFEFKLVRNYRTRVYVVQYRESNFNFVTRLLEAEGHQRLVLMNDGAAAVAVAVAVAVADAQVPPSFRGLRHNAETL